MTPLQRPERCQILRRTEFDNEQAQSAELRESWQRGPNENTNCLLRQYVSTRTDFVRCSRAHLNKAAHHLNERPRKALEFETRRSGVNGGVASTG